MASKAIILGASGLIGSNLLPFLLKNDGIESVTVFVRKELQNKNDKLKQEITDFKDLEILKSKIDADIIFCCLGSTKSKTPDLAKYRRIDHDIPLFFAQEGLNRGTFQYHVVSALGANSNSSNFYTRMKGEIEKDLKNLNYPSLYIYQPSFLEGDRKE
ncbi:MAG: NAD-dependent epimerase/dehydratase family protein, partial [Oligoflexus sp.]|nr:NAD-dependent epimerase/dehydratase family protein [Pseudopedobacter sp.]